MTVQPPHELDDSPEPEAGEITKRKVTMRNFTGFNPDGTPTYHEAIDYVPQEILDAYVTDAQTRWGFVEVGDLDAGPGGWHGPTSYPAHLPIPNAGEYRPPTPGSRVERALLTAEAESAARGGQPPDTGEQPPGQVGPGSAAPASDEER
jgi:hypothetical protein